MADNNKPVEVETLMQPLVSKSPGIPLYIVAHVRPYPHAGATGTFQSSYKLEHYVQLSILPDELKERVRDYIKQLMRV